MLIKHGKIILLDEYAEITIHTEQALVTGYMTKDEALMLSSLIQKKYQSSKEKCEK